MLEEIIGFDRHNIQPNHDRLMQEMIDYNSDLEHKLQIYTEYEEIDGIYKEEFIEIEQEQMYNIIGSAAALMFLYNRLEIYEYTHELHQECMKTFLLIYNEICPEADNTQKYKDVIEKMFIAYKELTQ
jgi:hypothetical protein